MLSVVENFKTGKLELARLPAPGLTSGCVLVANRASLISAGTERAAIELAKKSLAGKALERPDLVRQVLGKLRRDGLAATIATVRAKLDSPIPLGYSSAGVVLEAAAGSGFAVGERVACAGAKYATHSEVVSVPKNLCVPVPKGVSFEEASYVTMGAIAMHGVRQGEVSLGETVGVIGCGLLGLLAVQILAAGGARVFAIDLNAHRIDLARTLGAEAAGEAGSSELAAAVAAFSGGDGLDTIVITAATKSSDPIRLAARLARDRARVVVVGDVGMALRRRPFYEKELTLVMSRSYGPGRYDPNYEERGVEYPTGYVRWGERKNLAEFLRLVAEGKVKLDALTTHTFEISDALDAYDLVLGKRKEPFTGIVLTYPGVEKPVRKVTLKEPRRVEGPAVGVGFVGAGAFAQSVLLPAFARVSKAEPVIIASAGGLSAGHAGGKFGFREAASDFGEVIAHEDVDAVVIATRHNLHAEQAAAALAAGKHVFVEKPLALSRDELDKVRAAHEAAGRVLMVGFNRRFSPHALAAKALFAGLKRPLSINYRVNAGVVPKESWIQDSAVGGGRVLGELCHFVDLAAFFAGSPPASVYAVRAGGPHALAEDADSVAVTLFFENGSLAVISYVSSGDASFSKERIEIHGAGKSAVIEDFRRTLLTENGRRKTLKTSQDKGHRREVAAFVDGVLEGKAPLEFDELVASTLATFAVAESLSRGRRVDV